MLEDLPVISNQDIIRYNRNSYEFTISESSKKKLVALNDGFPFAVAVYKQIIYYGISKPSFSSSSCPHSITMDWVATGSKVLMRLGYAGTDDLIDDQRNNPKIIATLKSQNKLR